MTTTTPPEGAIRFAAVGLDHSHAFGQIQGLLDQGCQLVGLSSDDPAAAIARTTRERWPDAPWSDDPTSLLQDPSIDLIVTAAVPDRRAAIAVAALRNGKDVVADKPGCITLEQLDEVERVESTIERLFREGNGAVRQRKAFREGDDLIALTEVTR